MFRNATFAPPPVTDVLRQHAHRVPSTVAVPLWQSGVAVCAFASALRLPTRAASLVLDDFAAATFFAPAVPPPGGGVPMATVIAFPDAVHARARAEQRRETQHPRAAESR